MNYMKCCLDPLETLEDNDCGVKALAIACDLPYKLAHKLLKERGRKDRTGTQVALIFDVAESLGFKLTKVEGATPHKFGGTIRTLTTKLPAKGVYFTIVNGHGLVVRNGKVEDWSERSLRHVQHVYKVERKERKPRHKSNKAA